jgi:amino acid transporter
MYSYGGRCATLASRSSIPARARSIVFSIIIIATLYMAMTIVVLGLIPWQEAAELRTIASEFIVRTFADPSVGRVGGTVMTSLILFVAAASPYATILGYSRIPFAAARDGDFFSVFSKVHPTKHFPHVSLVVITL